MSLGNFPPQRKPFGAVVLIADLEVFASIRLEVRVVSVEWRIIRERLAGPSHSDTSTHCDSVDSPGNILKLTHVDLVFVPDGLGEAQ